MGRWGSWAVLPDSYFVSGQRASELLPWCGEELGIGRRTTATVLAAWLPAVLVLADGQHDCASGCTFTSENPESDCACVCVCECVDVMLARRGLAGDHVSQGWRRNGPRRGCKWTKQAGRMTQDEAAQAVQA